MERYCSVCGAEITQGTAQYGDWNAPLCRACFLSGKQPEKLDAPKEQLTLDSDPQGVV